MGSKGKNSTFSEQCHVAYQIKGNHECRSMVANILLPDPPPPTPYLTPPPPPPPPTHTHTQKLGYMYLWSEVQNSTFSEHGHVAYQMKRIMIEATWYQIFCLQTPLPTRDPGDGVNWLKIPRNIRGGNVLHSNSRLII